MNLVKQIPVRSNRGKHPSISIHKSGSMRFSALAVKEFSFKKGIRINLYQDKDNPTDWFFKYEEDGLLGRIGENGKAFYIQSTSIAKDILSSLGFLKKVQMRIAIKPIEGGYYAILTKSADGY